jgi:hypothetical protein
MEDGMTIDVYFAAVRSFQFYDMLQEDTLAGAGRADDGKCLNACYCQIDIF